MVLVCEVFCEILKTICTFVKITTFMSIIQSFEIKNFRCFKHTNVNGLGTINLFGGKNNVGKTALLEAILLMGEPYNDSIIRLLMQRRLSSDYLKSLPDTVWENFFYKQDTGQSIQLFFQNTQQQNYKIQLSISENIQEFVSMLPTNGNNTSNDLTNYLLADNKKSVITTEIFESTNKLKKHSLLASEIGMPSTKETIPYKLINTKFIPAVAKLTTEELAIQFGQAKLHKKVDKLLKAFQMIDNTIISVDSIQIGKISLLYLEKNNEKPLPINLFGDAMNKMADYVLSIINNENKILLLDEVENGIHHENQEKFWEMLFNLCNEFKVQVFATSHSQEMITAFNNVVKKHSFDGYYFRLSYHPIEKENIVAQKISTNVLEDKIENHQPYRS